MLASIHSGSSTKVWPEILHESERRQCTLFIFPGGRLASHDEYEYMRNGIFDLACGRGFDGVVSWASSLSGFASEKQVEDFLLSRIDVPLVTFGLKIGETPVVNIDTYSGMKQLVSHLAKRHKRRKIAYIGGPTAHSSAEERYRAYRDALEESGIGFDPVLASLDNSWMEGRKAMACLLDDKHLRPGKDFDAFCAASDLLAFEAAKLLQERGFRIPADIALGGFNDSDESNLFSPTYTTVRMPFERQALQAFHMLLERIEGKTPSDRMLKTQLVIRQSGGGLTRSVQLAGAATSARWKGNPGGRELPAESEILGFAAELAGFDEGEEQTCLKPLVADFLSCLSGRPSGIFINRLDTILNDFIFQDRDLETFQDILSALRISCGPWAVARKRTGIFETLLSQGRVLVSDAEKRISNYRAWKQKTVDHWLYILNHELLCAKDFEAVLSAAARFLPELDIRSGYFVLNGKDPGRRVFAGGFDATESRDGKARIIESKEGGRNFPSDLILPEELYSGCRGSYVVLPLHYESTSLGYMILRVHGHDASVFEEIRTQISSAMRGVLLFEQVNEARKRAEKAEKLKTEFLAGISGELQEPINIIYDTAVRLLADPGAAHREEIEIIASRSARQKELTRHLRDLSLAQVDEFELQAALFDPLLFAEGFAAESSSKRKKRKWGQIAPAAPPAAVPLAWGDAVRIRQVLEIFLDCVFRDLGAGTAEIALVAGPGGIVFGVGGMPGAAGAGNKIRELRGLLEMEPGLASLDRMKIEIELAKRIAFLHGGSLGCAERGGIFSLELILPYPSIGIPALREGRREKSETIGILGEGLPPALVPIFGSWKRKKIGTADAGSPAELAEEISLFYIDPGHMTGEEAAAAGILLERAGTRGIRCFANAAGLDGDSLSKASSLGEFLLGFVPARSAVTILVLGSGEHDDETARLLVPPAAGGTSVLRCGSPAELELLADRGPPRLIILAGQNLEFAAAVASSPGLAGIPLLCAAVKFTDPSLEKLLAERPRTVICNSGESFGDVITSTIARLSEGAELLPAPTGAIIMKSVFFLNRYFREQVSRWKLSEWVNASEDYLSRIFHRQMGIPLWEYLNRLRIGYAIELLKSSAESVAEIASRSGFQDQAYFCRVFRRITGLTPGSIRKDSGIDVRKVQ